jgi:hypothetical protein
MTTAVPRPSIIVDPARGDPASGTGDFSVRHRAHATPEGGRKIEGRRRVMRRAPSIIAVLASLLLASVALAPGVHGQDGQTATAEHPLVGAWIMSDVPPDPAGPRDLVVIHPDGTFVSVHVEEGVALPGLGPWSPSGERTADISLYGPVIEPEAGFVGFVIIRASLEVSEDGHSLTGTATYEFPAAMVQAIGLPEGQLGPLEVTGQRIHVEPMGEPVAPLPAHE